MHKGWLFGTFAAAMIAAACSSSSAPDPYPDVASFCTALAKAECNKVFTYCAIGQDACTTTRTANCNALAAGTPSKNPDIDPFAAVTPSRKYTSGSAQGCIDATNGIYATQAVTLAQFQSQQTSCNLVFQGSGQVNSACTSNFDCIGSLICDKSVCAQSSTVAQGSFCDSPGQVCDDNNYCAPQGNGNKVCTARPGSAAACSDTAPVVPCATGFICTNAVCAPQLGSGAACTSSAECGSQAPLCDPTISKCDADLLIGDADKACNLYGGTF